MLEWEEIDQVENSISPLGGRVVLVVWWICYQHM